MSMREGLGKSMVEMERNRMGPTPPQMYRSPMALPPQQGPGVDVVKMER
jgi:hypothetical protein